MIAHRFTCGERKILSNIEKSQDIMKVIVGLIPEKSSEIPLRQAGSLLIWTHFYRSFLKKVRSQLGEPAHLTEAAHLHMNSPLVIIFVFVSILCMILHCKCSLLLNLQRFFHI